MLVVDASTTLTGASVGIVEGVAVDVVRSGIVVLFAGFVEGGSKIEETGNSVVVELVVVGDVVPTTELVDSGNELQTVVDDGVTVDVVLGTVKVVEVVEVVVVELVVVDVVGGVVVVVDDVSELVEDVTLVGVGSLVVVSGFHTATLLSKSYWTPCHHLFGSPQHTPARNRYVPGCRFTDRYDCNPNQSSFAAIR